MEESGFSRAGPAENSCGHSSATTLQNIPFEPREAEPPLGGKAFYADVPFEPREAKPGLRGKTFYADIPFEPREAKPRLCGKTFYAG